MHFAFIPYGARQEVERFMRDVESQKFQLKMTKEGEQDRFTWVNGQVRLLPFGVVEIIFPREARDPVLTTMLTNTAPNRLAFDRTTVYNMVKKAFTKVLGLKSIPEDYSKDQKVLWDLEHVSIIPLGIREDVDLVECKEGFFKDWLHEGI